jgi:SAM-dependent methyltransferase
LYLNIPRSSEFWNWLKRKLICMDCKRLDKHKSRHRSLKHAVALICLFAPLKAEIPNVNISCEHTLKTLFQDTNERSLIDGFISNVLRQGKFNLLADLTMEYLASNSNVTNKDIYNYLKEHSSKYYGNLLWIQKIKALHHQKEIISSQIKQLLPATANIETYLEIGTQGTYVNSIKQFKDIKKAFILSEIHGFSDYIYGISLNPFKKFKAYDQWFPLDGYKVILPQSINDESIDMVSCIIGLHHITPDKLEFFIASIARVLKPGGFFVLREHDAKNDILKRIISGAHTLYNLIASDLPYEEESREYRNFQPLIFWIIYLEKHGLLYQGKTIFQKGDPTANALMLFVKKDDSQHIDPLLNSEMSKREFTNTFLSAPEWQNVMTAAEYAEFITHTPFYEFPYWRSVRSFWHVFSESWQQARKTKSIWKLITEDYIQMNLFVGAFMTIEYGFKAIISAPIRWLVGGDEAKTINLVVDDPENKLQSIWPEMRVLKTTNNTQKLIEMPRYKALQKAIESLDSNEKVSILSIAGQSHIQITIKHDREQPILFRLEGLRHLYNWELPTDTKHYLSAYLVPVKQVFIFIQNVKNQNGKIITIHDF